MAIINCPECNEKVSTFASACPHCGYPIGTRPERSPKNKKEPNDEVALYLDIAKMAYKHQNYSSALMYCEMVIEIDPSNYTAWAIRGMGTLWIAANATVTESYFERAKQKDKESEMYVENARNMKPKDVKDEYVDMIDEERNRALAIIKRKNAEMFNMDLRKIMKGLY